MRHWVHACAAAVIGGSVAAAMLSHAAEPVATKPTELVTTPLAGDPTREVKILSVILPPGADSGRHVHHGDQYTTVQEGEIKVTIDGAGERVLKAGEALHIDPMIVHRTQNVSDKPARTTEFFIIAKGLPLGEKVE